MKNDSDNTLKNAPPILIDFHADWCGPCQTLSPLLEEVKADLGDELKLIDIDVDRNKALAKKFQVRSIPTMILFKDDQEVWRRAGILPKREIKSVIEKFS